ncbi:MAG TPA: putative PEP-binding protein, partial [Candidatus Limnocylindria bacterium]|nr:putative PEP-binding protein [Candidatus Limnocylindria bacterium]
MAELVLQGTPASPGVAIGGAWKPHEPHANGHTVPQANRSHEANRAIEALARSADALMAVASGLERPEAEIVEAGALMARDPALVRAVRGAVEKDGLTSAAAIVKATDVYADAIAAVGDETLAARADDVRSLGRRAARLLGGQRDEPPGSDLVLVAHDLGPADVAEMAPALAGIALVGGGPTAHAAIVARSLGIPMVTGLPDAVLTAGDGTPAAIDGGEGTVVLEPIRRRAAKAAEAMREHRLAEIRARAESGRPARTLDGRRVGVLANVASAPELDVATAAGAEGIGLLRTELAFLDAHDWPSERQHFDSLEPILAGLGDRPAVVRVLDFGADKAPPFLAGDRTRGIELLLANEVAFVAQLRAIVRCARGRDLRIMLPMVDRPEQLTHSHALLDTVAAELEADRVPPLGSMIETPSAAAVASELAAGSAFLSIGTNDLTATTLGADRFDVNHACAHHPEVLALIALAVNAGHDAG